MSNICQEHYLHIKNHEYQLDHMFFLLNLQLRWKRREVSCQSRRGLWESGVKHTIEVANGFICNVCTWGETPRESCPTTTTCGGCGATEIWWLSGLKNRLVRLRPFGCRFSTYAMVPKNVGFFQAKSEAEAEKRRLAERKERLLLKADDHGEAGADPWSAVPTGRWNKTEYFGIFWYFLDGFLWSKNTNIPKYLNPKYYFFFPKKSPKI